MDEIIDRCSAAIRREEHGTVNNAREDLTSVSKIGVVSAFREFSFGNNLMGIYGSISFDILHAWLLGLMEYMLEGVYLMFSPKKWLFGVKRDKIPI
jgi:peptide subunit release factor RF-3